MKLFSSRGGGTGRRGAPRNRGMALLMVLTTLAVLTAVVVDFSFNTRIDSSLAANARDELRAYYLARSASSLGRLVLHFQFMLDQQANQAQQAMSKLSSAGGAGGGQLGALAAMAGGGGGAGGMMGMLGNIRLWDIIPVDSGAINMFVGAAAGPPDGEPPPPPAAPQPGEAVPVTGLATFGSYEGSFHAEFQDEEAKLNLNKINNPGSRGAIAATQLLLLWNDPRWDFLFEAESVQRERYSREDILSHFRDYVDEDEQQTSINLQAPGEAFQPGFADETGPYARYEQRYGPKNALFDTMDELYLVPGVTDRFMAAFRDRITVYPDINSRLNVNTNDPVQQYVNILAAAQDPTLPLLRDPTVIKAVLDEIALSKMFGPFIGLSLSQFVQIVESAGITVLPALKHNAAQNDYLGDKSQSFTIKAVGTVGAVQRTIVTVVRYDQGLGKLLYYREE